MSTALTAYQEAAIAASAARIHTAGLQKEAPMSTALTAYQEAAIAASAAREALLTRQAELKAELGEIKALLGRKKREPKAPKEKKTRKSKHGIELAQQA